MNKCINTKIAFAVLAGLSAVVAQGYTVSSGAPVTVTDENKSEIEQDGSISLADATSTIIYSTSTAPGVPISGAGTILKTGTSDWTLRVNNSNFTGTYAFSGGKVTFTDILQLGKDTASMHVFSTNGATLCAMDSNQKIKFSKRTLHIEGTGVNNAGAFMLGSESTNPRNSELMGQLVLEGDALMVLDYQMYHRGKITLNGHTLTKDGGSATVEWYLQEGGTDGTGSIVVKKGTVQIAQGWASAPSDVNAGPIVFQDGVKFNFRNQTPVQYRPMRIEGTVQAANSEQYTYSGFTSDYRHQAGPVVLADGATLQFTGTKDELMKTFSGPISGNGSLTLTSSNRGRFYLANPTNSFTGNFSAAGGSSYWPDLTAAYSNSIPDYSKFSVATLRVRVPMSDDSSTWCPDSVVRLARTMAVSDTGDTGTGVSIVTDDCTDDAYTFDFSRVTDPVITPASSKMRIMHEGNGKVSFTGGADLRSIPVGSIGGVAEFTGEGEFLLGEVFAFSKPAYAASDDGKEATVLFNGAKNVVSTNKLIRIGSTGASPAPRITGGIGRMIVSNSTLTTKLLTNESATWTEFGGICPGCYGTGVLEVASGAILTNRLYVGRGGKASFYKSVGAVVQSGGEFAVIGVADANNNLGGASAIGIVDGAHGYYELNGGRVVFLGSSGLGRDTGGFGIVMQHGGRFDVTNSISGAHANLNVGLSGNGRGVFYMDGGTNLFSGLNCSRSGLAKTKCVSEVTIDGDSRFIHAGTYICCNYCVDGYPSSTFNFNGGVFEATFFSNRNGTDGTPYVRKPELYFNFNGGALKLTGTDANRTNGRDPFAGYGGRPPADFVCVYEKGATIDTADCDAISSVPFIAPPGKGVSAIDWTADGYVAPPCVVIDGDGTNATAIALYDSSTRRVTGVKITSHGWGYTTATAYFISGSVTNGSAVCTLADNVSGSFTKKGPKTFTFMAANTYAGATILAEGSLKCGVDHAIPASSTIVLAGGTLNMNGKTLSDGSTMPKNWAVDRGAAIAAGTPITYDGDLSFPEGSTLSAIGGDVDSTTPSATLLVVTGTVSGSPTLVDTAESPRHRLHWSGNKLRYTRLNGTYISFR